MKLPTLYKKTSNGKIEQWTISVHEVTNWGKPTVHPPYNVVTEHGHVGGKLQQSIETVTEGKNLGKANATTVKQQAESQAQSEWNTKLTRKGYVDSLAKAAAGENDGAGGIRPMLAQAFAKHGDKIEFPCFAQPKLDGIRCIAVVDEDEVTLWSREQKPITAVPHIARAIVELGLPAGTVLDGELYNHTFRSDFEKIVSAVRKQGPVDVQTASLIEYHIYDAPRTGSPRGFSERSNWLMGAMLVKMMDPRCPLRYVETEPVDDQDALMAYFAECRGKGYEGCMVRSADAPYEEGKRSYHLQKLKEFDDKEYKIVGVERGVGKMADCAIFVCVTEDGTEFRCKMEGKLDDLKKYVDDPSLAIGKMLTTQFQGLTGKSKVPRFPVGKAVRDYE